MKNAICAWWTFWKPFHMDVGTIGWPIGLGTCPSASLIPWKKNKKNKVVETIWLATWDFQKEILSYLVNSPQLGCCYEVLQCGSSTWRELTSNSITLGGMSKIVIKSTQHNIWYGKAYLSMLELHRTLFVMMQIGQPSMMMCLKTMTKFGEGTNFSIIETTLLPCIGTS